MGYVLSEEQQFLAESARDLLKKFPVSLVRELRDSDDELGYSERLWQRMVEMGWPGLAVSEANGGLEFGFRSLGVILSEAGRSLSASPLLSTTVAYRTIEKFGNAEQLSFLADKSATNEIMSIAFQESKFFKPDEVKTTAKATGQEYHLSGTKEMVADGHMANHMIVSAITDDGITAFLVDCSSNGFRSEKEFMMDSRYYSQVHLNEVAVDARQVLGTPGEGLKVINEVMNVANALLSAELVGLMEESFERTVSYLKERRQFDKLIGTFQGLQHRAADLYGEIELAKSITIKALDALDNDDFMAPAFCSMAKAKCIKVAQLATNEGIQMFGGIGMTDDEEIGFFLKRSRVAAQQFGGYSLHLDRFAQMNGY